MRTVVLACILSIGLGSYAQTDAQAAEKKKLTDQEIWYSRTFSGDYVGGLASMNDGEHYSVLDQSDKGQRIDKYAYRTGNKVGTILGPEAFVPAGAKEAIQISSYSFNSDESKVILATDEESIYRYSTKGNYYLYDLETKKLVPLTDHTKGKQTLATISPDGKRAAFVRNNNIFWVDLSNMEEAQVTFDGAQNSIINGTTDWVYEEEFAIIQGFKWSEDGRKILFLRFDESQVREFNMAIYARDLYPSEYRFKYPKAGETNSTVSLHVHSILNQRTEQVPIPIADEGEFYIPRFGWTEETNTAWYMVMNRLQNKKLIYKVEIPLNRGPQMGLKPREIYREQSKTYIEVGDDLSFLSKNKGFVLTSTRSGFNHIYHYDMSGKLIRTLTKGNWDVISIDGVDEKRKRILYTSAEAGPSKQEIYQVGLSGKGKRRLSPAGGWNSADFSKTYNYFINSSSSANDPGKISLYDANGKLINVLKDNSTLKNNLAEYDLQPKEFMTITAPAGHTLDAWMIKPQGFQSRERYPVLFAIYGGPGHNTVTDSWGGRNYLWHQQLAQEGYIVVSVDPRGTERKGSAFKHATYGQMGKLETEDMVAMANWLKKQPWVDPDRIGIQGWSYGGYMSSLCLMKANDVFKCAIAVAPVTNWRFYDTIYTERYMGIPQDNPDGYDKNSPINYVADLKGPYFLVHGTADDNVHWQNTAEMISALVRENKHFEQFIYPDRNHGIYGGTTRWHLFSQMTEFLKENL